MFNSHLLKVLVGFCGVILLGLISLVIIDSMKEKDKTATAPQTTISTSTTLPPPVSFGLFGKKPKKN